MGKEKNMDLLAYILCALGAWIVGLLLDANLGFEPLGFLCLRLLLPLLVTGCALLKAIKDQKK